MNQTLSLMLTSAPADINLSTISMLLLMQAMIRLKNKLQSIKRAWQYQFTLFARPVKKKCDEQWGLTNHRNTNLIYCVNIEIFFLSKQVRDNLILSVFHSTMKNWILFLINKIQIIFYVNSRLDCKPYLWPDSRIQLWSTSLPPQDFPP